MMRGSEARGTKGVLTNYLPPQSLRKKIQKKENKGDLNTLLFSTENIIITDIVFENMDGFKYIAKSTFFMKYPLLEFLYEKFIM